MNKLKLAEARKRKGFSQEYMANVLCMDTSSYSRRENGLTRLSHQEWQKLADILQEPLENIYEPEESMTFIFSDNSSGNGNIVTNYAIPQSVLDSQKKYIEKLEEENRSLKEEMLALKDEIK